MNLHILKKMFTLFFLLFSVLVALHIPVQAFINSPLFYYDQTQTFSLNTSNNFKIFRTKGLALSNIQDKTVVTLSKSQKKDSLYDLYFGFNQNDYLDNYQVISSNYQIKNIQNNFFGKFVLDNSIILLPKKRSIFNLTAENMQNFSIQFSLLPYAIGEGSQIIVSFKNNTDSDLLKNYGFTISIDAGIITYHFDDFFQDAQNNKYSFKLQEQAPLIDQQLEQHTIVVNMQTKTIKAYRNGIENDVKILTDNQTIYGKTLFHTSLFTQKETPIPLIIGQNGIFALNNFAIFKESIQNKPDRVPNEINYLETDVVTLSSNDSWLDSINIDLNHQNNSAYKIAYRFSRNYFLPETDVELLPWVYIDPKKNNFPPSYSLGKYMQWRFEYFNPIQSSLTNIELYSISTKFREIPSPSIPSINTIIAKDQKIEISWNTLPDDLIESYEIYYGSEPNVYFGKATISPNSPVIINALKSEAPSNMHYSLEGIENNRPYYIAIRAKNIYGSYGSFSKEVSAIPLSTENELGYSIGR